jgi:hypothetical protein
VAVGWGDGDVHGVSRGEKRKHIQHA